MTTPTDRYERRARPILVVDGDTLDVTFDLGFGIRHDRRVRLLGVDTPELRSSDPAERAAAEVARLFVREWLDWSSLWPLVVRTRQDRADKYGRLLARVWRSDGAELGRDLVDAGHARVYLP